MATGKNIFSRVARWGQDPAMDDWYNRRVAIANSLIMVSIALAIFLASLFFYQGAKILFLHELVAIGVYSIALLCSLAKRVEWAKIIALLYTNGGMFAYLSSAGINNKFSFSVFTLALVPFVVFEFRQWFKISLFVLMPLISFGVLNIVDYQIINLYVLPEHLKNIIFLTLLISSAISIVACAVFLVKERVDDQLKLSDKQSLISQITEISPNIIYIYNITEDKVVYSNQNIPKILGYDNDFVLKLNTPILRNLIHPEDLPTVISNSKKLFKTISAEPVITPYRIKNANGEYVYIRNRSQVLERDKDGRVKLVLGVSEDITESVKEQEAFVVLNDLQKNILEASPYAIISCDKDGVITTFNRAAENMFGYSAADFVGKKTPGTLIDRKELEQRAQQLSEELNTTIEPAIFALVQRPLLGLPETNEWTCIRKDGTRYPAQISITALKNKKGNIAGFLGIVQDITLRKQEEELLKKAKYAAEEANRAKSQFLANMSHEIRTPLNGILGMTDLTLESDLNAEQRQYLGYVKESGTNLLHVINDILDFSKIESGIFELYPTDFNLLSVINSALKTASIKAYQKNIELYCNIENGIPETLIGDSVRINQILTNLLGNATKFTDKGFVALSVDKLDDNGDYVELRFSIQDTGIGIPKNKQDYIFQAFAQVDDSHKRTYQGTGLGLSISKRLVEQMHGRIWLESELGKGSTFNFTVKLKVSLQKEPAKVSFNHIQLLVLADNELKRATYHNIATLLNVPCQTLSVVNELGKLLHPYNQNILLVDIDEEATALGTLVNQIELQAENTPLPKYIALSPKVEVEAKPALESLGFKCLLKPLITTELEAVLKEYPSRVRTSENDVKPISGRYPILNEAEAGPLKFLVVEDNDVNRLLTTRVIEKIGHQVHVAEDGAQAVEMVKQATYDMIVMDIQMPQMDGIEATQKIRVIDAEREIHTPIIAMTAHAMKGDREKYLEQGMDEYISKPFDRKQLEEKINELRERFAMPTKVLHNLKNEAMGTTANKKLDLSYLEELLNGNNKAIREVLGMFVIQTPQLLGEMHRAYSTGDLTDLSKLTHKLKGTLVAIGVNGTDMERLKTLEEKSRLHEDGIQIKPILDTSTSSLMGIVDEIKTYVSTLDEA